MIVDILHLNNSNKNSLEILISYFLIRREDLSFHDTCKMYTAGKKYCGV